MFPNTPKLYVPTLRVDVVGLPDLLKSEKKNPPGKTLDDIQKMLEKAQADASKVKKIAAAESRSASGKSRSERTRLASEARSR